METLIPEARAFLEDACEVAQRYDREGDGLLPVETWPLILEDLGLQEGSGQAQFLMDRLQGVGESHFTYVPLLQGLGAPRPQPETPPPCSPPAEDWLLRERGGRTPERRPSPADDPPSATPPGSPERAARASSPPSTPPGPGASPQKVPNQQFRTGKYQVSPGAAAASPFPDDEAGDALGPLPGGHYGGIIRDWGDVESVACNELEEINEAFWARRATETKSLFTQWDCNQLTNEKFQGCLQKVLGASVDISHTESEFLRLANRHRTARNAKYAQLMQALRRDAHNSMCRRLGRQPLSALPSCAGSYAGSVAGYEPSESGFSEAPSHAAGRPSRAAQSQSQSLVPQPGGKRHYQSSAASLDGHMGGYPGSRAGGSVAGGSVAGGGAGAGYGPQAGQPPSPSKVLFAQQMQQIQIQERGAPQPAGASPPPAGRKAEADPDFWSRNGPGAGSGLELGASEQQERQQLLLQQRRLQDERWRQRPQTSSAAQGVDHEVVSVGQHFDNMSVAASDGASVADSQREGFNNRNRTGHGNILTWGDSSRDLTPTKREGRQQVENRQGRLRRVTDSSDIFHQGS